MKYYFITLFMSLCIFLSADETLNGPWAVTWILDDNLTITSAGTINTTDEHGIEAISETFWIENYGSIQSTGNTISGIKADYMSGDITNHSTGLIQGSFDGITSWYYSGTINNYGVIRGVNNHGIDMRSSSGSLTNHVGAAIYGNGNYDYGVRASGMIGNVYNYSIISGQFFGIETAGMIGTFYNYDGGVVTGYASGAYANVMVGNIENAGIISAQVSGEYDGIWAKGMSGTITNYSTGVITANNANAYGINAENMTGLIHNSGFIHGGYSGIYYTGMTNHIYNYDGGEISSDRWGIYAANSSGNVYNYSGATISGTDVGIYWLNPNGIIYNYGTISGNNQSLAIGDGAQVVGNGYFDGNIQAFGPTPATLHLSNDVDGTVLDLSDAPLVNWTEVRLLDGEMIIESVTNTTVVNQNGSGTMIHLGQDNLNYNLNAGTLNPYSDLSPYKTLTFNNLNVATGSTIEMNVGNSNDMIINANIATGVTLKLVVSDPLLLQSYQYQLFDNTTFDGPLSVNVVLPVLYYLVDISNDQYFYTIARDPYTKYANKYNIGFASLMETVTIPSAMDLRTQIEQAETSGELNSVLDDYNLSGYASLANNNISNIGSRNRQLFNRMRQHAALPPKSEPVEPEPVDEGETKPGSTGSADPTQDTDVIPEEVPVDPAMRDQYGNSIWVDLNFSNYKLDGEVGYKMDTDTTEFAVGIDHQINNEIIIGGSLYYHDSSSDIDGGPNVSVDTEGFGLNGYGYYTQEQFDHKMIIGLTNFTSDANRDGADADFDSNELYLAYRLEYKIERESFSLRPFAGLHYAIVSYDDIKESGTLSLEGYDYNSLQTEIGLKAIKEFNNKLRTYASLAWMHELMDTESDAKATSEFGSYDQAGLERDSDTFELSIGARYQFNDQMSLHLGLAKEFGSDSDATRFNAMFSISF